eukprot:Gb_22702 [translate_table: standard]
MEGGMPLLHHEGGSLLLLILFGFGLAIECSYPDECKEEGVSFVNGEQRHWRIAWVSFWKSLFQLQQMLQAFGFSWLYLMTVAQLVVFAVRSLFYARVLLVIVPVGPVMLPFEFAVRFSLAVPACSGGSRPEVGGGACSICFSGCGVQVGFNPMRTTLPLGFSFLEVQRPVRLCYQLFLEVKIYSYDMVFWPYVGLHCVLVPCVVPKVVSALRGVPHLWGVVVEMKLNLGFVVFGDLLLDTTHLTRSLQLIPGLSAEIVKFISREFSFPKASCYLPYNQSTHTNTKNLALKWKTQYIKAVDIKNSPGVTRSLKHRSLFANQHFLASLESRNCNALKSSRFHYALPHNALNTQTCA